MVFCTQVGEAVPLSLPISRHLINLTSVQACSLIFGFCDKSLCVHRLRSGMQASADLARNVKSVGFSVCMVVRDVCVY